MYKSNLAWQSLNNVTGALASGGLITAHPSGKSKIWEITDKGMEAVAFIQKANELVPYDSTIPPL
jgi:predicted transcriptional regulator